MKILMIGSSFSVGGHENKYAIDSDWPDGPKCQPHLFHNELQALTGHEIYSLAFSGSSNNHLLQLLPYGIKKYQPDLILCELIASRLYNHFIVENDSLLKLLKSNLFTSMDDNFLAIISDRDISIQYWYDEAELNIELNESLLASIEQNLIRNAIKAVMESLIVTPATRLYRSYQDWYAIDAIANISNTKILYWDYNNLDSEHFGDCVKVRHLNRILGVNDLVNEARVHFKNDHLADVCHLNAKAQTWIIKNFIIPCINKFME